MTEEKPKWFILSSKSNKVAINKFFQGHKENTKVIIGKIRHSLKNFLYLFYNPSEIVTKKDEFVRTGSTIKHSILKAKTQK